MIAYFDCFSIKMTLEQAESCTHFGPCDEDVAALSKVPKIKKQLDRLPPGDLAATLKEYGAWDKDELSDHEQNLQRILWIAAGNIKEEKFEKNRK